LQHGLDSPQNCNIRTTGFFFQQILNIYDKETSGPNTIIPKVLKRNISNSIKAPLTTLFNLRLEKGQAYDIKKKISQYHTSK
jgi:hypothetical protein